MNIMATPDRLQLKRLIMLVCEVLITTPEPRRKAPHQKTVYVNWDIVQDLRKLLVDDLGFDEVNCREKFRDFIEKRRAA